jgi:hypothetical protein
MTLFNQNAVVKKLNEYLETKNRELVLELGYCHGFTLLWLYKMSRGKEQWFYDTIQKIILHEGKNYTAIEADIEEFLAHIEWMQNSEKYQPDILQLDIDKIFEWEDKIALSAVMNTRELDRLLKHIIQPDLMICLSSPNHTIGVFRRGEKYFLFNPNFPNGIAEEFDNLKSLKQQLISSLYTKCNIPTKTFSLQVNILKNPREESKSTVNKTVTLEETIATTAQAQAVDHFGINSLYLASENNDAQTITYLLTKGSLVNQQNIEGKTALFIAALCGYNEIANILIAHSANPNLAEQNGQSPLYAAVAHKRVSVVRMLLANGANMLQATKQSDTPLNRVIEERSWTVFASMLIYVKDLTALQNKYGTIFQRHQEAIAKAIAAESELLPKTSANYLLYLGKKIVADEEQNYSAIRTRKSTRNRHRFFPYNKPATKTADENQIQPGELLRWGRT